MGRSKLTGGVNNPSTVRFATRSKSDKKREQLEKRKVFFEFMNLFGSLL